LIAFEIEASSGMTTGTTTGVRSARGEVTLIAGSTTRFMIVVE
jgi:hypothetical protein